MFSWLSHRQEHYLCAWKCDRLVVVWPINWRLRVKMDIQLNLWTEELPDWQPLHYSSICRLRSTERGQFRVANLASHPNVLVMFKVSWQIRPWTVGPWPWWSQRRKLREPASWSKRSECRNAYSRLSLLDVYWGRLLLSFNDKRGAEPQLGLISIWIWCYLNWISGLVWTLPRAGQVQNGQIYFPDRESWLLLLFVCCSSRWLQPPAAAAAASAAAIKLQQLPLFQVFTSLSLCWAAATKSKLSAFSFQQQNTALLLWFYYTAMQCLTSTQ